jgi:hypothetical protein
MKSDKNPALLHGLLRLGAIAAPLVIATMALAQGTGLRQPKLDSAPSPVIGYAIMAVLTGMVLAISLYPSKRAHTDL